MIEAGAYLPGGPTGDVGPVLQEGHVVDRGEVERASVRRLCIRIRNTEGTEEGERTKARLYEAINRYLSAFVAPGPRQTGMFSSGFRCAGCGSYLGGYLGTFRWGIVHGEGACSVCHHPARAFHVVRLDGEKAASFTEPLSCLEGTDVEP